MTEEKQPKQKKQKETREERLERFARVQKYKVEMAKERGTQVIRTDTPLGRTLCMILRQFDPAYNRFKGVLGELGGIPYDEGAKIMEEMQDITLSLSRVTKKLCKQVGFRYTKPVSLKNISLPSQPSPSLEPQKEKSEPAVVNE